MTNYANVKHIMNKQKFIYIYIYLYSVSIHVNKWFALGTMNNICVKISNW